MTNNITINHCRVSPVTRDAEVAHNTKVSPLTREDEHTTLYSWGCSSGKSWCTTDRHNSVPSDVTVDNWWILQQPLGSLQTKNWKETNTYVNMCIIIK